VGLKTSENGMDVSKAGFSIKKNKYLYDFTSEDEFIKYLAKAFLQSNHSVVNLIKVVYKYWLGVVLIKS
jgi:hypothetical protein